MSSTSSFSASAPKVFNVAFSNGTLTQLISLSSSLNNIIVNISYNLTNGSNVILNINNVPLNSALFNFNILDNSTYTSTAPPNLSVVLNNTSTIISNIPILPDDVISYFLTPNGSGGFTGSSVTSSKDIYNNLTVNYTTGATGPSLSNPLMTKGQIQANLPDLLFSYLDSSTSTGFTGIGPESTDNKIVTTLNLANDLAPYLVQSQLPLSKNPGGNKLVTSYGNAALVSNFFGSLSSNPGFVTAVASEIINNNNITSINIGNNSTISLVDTFNITPESATLFQTIDDYLGYTGSTAHAGTSGPVNFLNLTLTPSAAVSFISDPFYSNSSPSLLVQGNLLNSSISPPTSTLNQYALVRGLLPMNSYISGATAALVGATGPMPVFEFVDASAIIIGTGANGATSINLLNNTGILSFNKTNNLSFPCTAYGIINNVPANSSSYTIPASTYSPSIINAMLPLYTELAVASGLVFSNEVDQLKNEIDQLTGDLGALGAITNYLQSYSENIYVVGLYTSVITINGNSAPIGYSYYNGYGYTGTIGNAPSAWSGSLYTPPPLILNLTGFALPPPDTQDTTTNVNTSDFTGNNSCDGIPNQTIYPIMNTIIIPFSYKGFGAIGTAPGGCNHPPYVLSINLNNIYYTGTPPTGYSNGYIIQQGTTIKICNESNYIVQLTSRNITYNGAYPTTTSTPSNILPVPVSPFTSFRQITPTPDANPPNRNSGYRGVTGPNAGWPFTSNYTNPLVSSSITTNGINLRDTTSDVIYIKAGDSIRLAFSQNSNGIGGTWGYL